MELRRLVPQAISREGSTKLEKAEILQMTVDHLRSLQNTNKGIISVYLLKVMLICTFINIHIFFFLNLI